MLTTLRRSLHFRRKIRTAGLRLVGTDWVRPETIRIPHPDAWVAGQIESAWQTVYDTPHYKLLTSQRHEEIIRTDYWAWQQSIRGIDHPRPDEWIQAMTERLQRLHASIRADGYRLRCVADRIAVMTDGILWDGGHRLACLAAEEWMLVPVVWVGRP